MRIAFILPVLLTGTAIPLAAQTTSTVPVVVGQKQSADSIVVPPETSWTVSVGNGVRSQKINGGLQNWVHSQSGINGLEGVDAPAWHIVITFDRFDEDGDKVQSGELEEFWAGQKKYKRIYKGTEFSQTDYSSEKGIFRSGDQRWPNRYELLVRSEVVTPFQYASTLQDVAPKLVSRTLGQYVLDCVAMEDSGGGIHSPTQYCFDHDGKALRYVRGSGWNQTAYNDVISFSGRFLGQDVTVSDGGKPFLKLHVKTIENIVDQSDALFEPPSNAVRLNGGRVSGVQTKVLKPAFPEWPDSVRQQHFKVRVALVVGKDGRVISAKAFEGPVEMYKYAESAAKKWVFQPYLVQGEPVEVETRIELSNN